jgi:hypothetical protein
MVVVMRVVEEVACGEACTEEEDEHGAHEEA